MASRYARRIVELLPKLAPDQRRDVIEEVQELAEQEAIRRQRRKRVDIIRRTCGALAHIPTTSEDYAREKQGEIEREERKWRG